MKTVKCILSLTHCREVLESINTGQPLFYLGVKIQFGNR